MSTDFAISGQLELSSPRGRLVEFTHPDSGARHVHVDCDDENTAFMLCFRTPAPANNGLTHVLEHLLLSGSDRFSEPNPFFAMMKRSVAATMNASTGCDIMRLHFSTRSQRDFDALLDFYLDSAFFPRLDQADFNREAGRVVDDASTGSPAFNGIVYNEMKGAMSRPEFHLCRGMYQRLFPSTCHGLNEGGDWWRIPALTLQEVRDYHRRHFVAANALFLTYGKLDVRRCQDRLLSQALNRCGKGSEAPMPDPPRLDRAEKSSAPLPHELETPRYFRARGIRISGGDTQSDAVMARLFFEHLLGAGGGPPAWLDESGLTFRGREPVLVLGLETPRPPAAGNDDPFHEAIERAAADPPRPEELQAGVSRVRTRLLDDQTGRDAAGIRVLERIAFAAVYGDPVQCDPGGLVQQVFEYACDRENLRSWVVRHLLENTDQVYVDAYTDRSGFLGVIAEERRGIGKALTRAPLPAADARRLSLPREARPPALSAVDLAGMIGRDVAFQAAHAPSGVDLVPCEVGDLCYLTLVFEPDAGRPVPLERLALDIEGIRQSLERRADAVECTVDLRARVTGRCSVRLLAELTAPSERASSAARSVLDLIGDGPVATNGADRDAARAARHRLAAARGHEMALKSALRPLGENAAADHCINGLGLLPALDLDAQQAGAAEPGESSPRWGFARALVLCAAREAPGLVDRLGLPARRDGPVGVTVPAPPPTGHTEPAWLVPGSLAHCALAVELKPLDAKHQAAAAVLCRILVDRILEPAIRFKGGAYGVDCRYFPEFNAIGMCSFRDPRPGDTLNAFDRALRWLRAGDFDEAALASGMTGEFARLQKLCRTRVLEIRQAFDIRLEGDIISPARYARAVTEVNAADLREAGTAVRDRVSRAVVCGPDSADEMRRRGFEAVTTGRHRS